MGIRSCKTMEVLTLVVRVDEKIGQNLAVPSNPAESQFFSSRV